MVRGREFRTQNTGDMAVDASSGDRPGADSALDLMPPASLANESWIRDGMKAGRGRVWGSGFRRWARHRGLPVSETVPRLPHNSGVRPGTSTCIRVWSMCSRQTRPESWARLKLPDGGDAAGLCPWTSISSSHPCTHRPRVITISNCWGSTVHLFGSLQSTAGGLMSTSESVASRRIYNMNRLAVLQFRSPFQHHINPP